MDTARSVVQGVNVFITNHTASEIEYLIYIYRYIYHNFEPTRNVIFIDSVNFQELIFRIEGFKPFGWFLTLVQFMFYTLFGLLELQTKEDKSRK